MIWGKLKQSLTDASHLEFVSLDWLSRIESINLFEISFKQ